MKRFFLFLFVFLTACTGTRPELNGQNSSTKNPRERVIASVDSLFNSPLFNHAHWGVLVKSLRTDEIWYERNADKMFMPASNEKIITGAVSLQKLGPDFRYVTTIGHRGSIVNGILKGDLVVFGSGDPSFNFRFWDDNRAVLKKWAKQLKNKGIREITGDLIGDDNAFEDYPYGSGWPFDDFDYYYSAEIGAFQLNENYIDLEIIPPRAAGEAMKVQPSTPSRYYTIENNLQVVPNGPNSITISRPFGTNRLMLKGQVTLGGNPLTDAITITNPTLFFMTVFKEVLEAEGIKISGSARDCDDIVDYKGKPTDVTVLVSEQSPPFSKLLAEMMKVSQNLYAETFTKTLGWQTTGIGSFEAGKSIVQQQLAEWGIPANTYVYADGSGLSRYNYTSPRILSNVLTQMRHSPHWLVFWEAMPIAGIDGTIRNRMKTGAAFNNLRAKTGTIANTRSLSGYLTTADGEELVFSFMVNGHLLSSRDADRITDTAANLLAGLKR